MVLSILILELSLELVRERELFFERLRADVVRRLGFSVGVAKLVVVTVLEVLCHLSEVIS